MKFTALKIDKKLLQGIKDAGFKHCTEVQAETLPHILAGRDVSVQSQTGTGKTAAFLIGIFDHFCKNGDKDGQKALVVAPTRELAVQIEKEAELLGRHLDLRIGCIYGGVGYGRQEKLLQDGADVIIGTPGRLIDFSRSGKLDFRRIGIFVIDEADRLFDMGFIKDLRFMFRRMVAPENRRTMLFSATLDSRVRHLAWEHMNRPVTVEIKPEKVTVEEVDQILYHVARARKMSLLIGILKREQPENGLIFTNTKRAAEEVAKRLELNGYHARYIIGDLPQKKRQMVLAGLKEGTCPFLVATDVAARGLHIEGLDLVVNYDLPEDREGYVHRIGRTARAGKTGKAISLVCERYVYGLEAIERFTNEKIPVGRLDEAMFVADKSAGKRVQLDRYRDGSSSRRSGSSRGGSSRSRRAQGGKPSQGRRPPSRGKPSSAARGDSRSRRSVSPADRPPAGKQRG